jgi:hypothetical protein
MLRDRAGHPPVLAHKPCALRKGAPFKDWVLPAAKKTAGEAGRSAARALAEAQLELKRIRATRVAAIPIELDEMLNPRTLARLCAFDRYERQPASRREAAQRWLEEIPSSRQ